MARSTAEIQQELQSKFMASAAVQELYGFNPGESFGNRFAKVSIESILIYIVAYCAYVLETLFDSTKKEVEERFLQQLPGTCLWYAQKLKGYLYNFQLDEWGNPITEGSSDGDIAAAQIIKHAVAIDDPVSGFLLLKIAGEDGDGHRTPLTSEQETALREYILRVKYAGVKTKLINAEGDQFNCNVDVWYDPLLNESEVHEQCQAAVKNYIENLPFNGEFSIMSLTDALQIVSGVKVVQVRTCGGVDALNVGYQITDKYTPYAGYFNYDENNVVIRMTAY